eukprot:TRINITY_DN8268_c0_g1_i1.p1 TRINITY_DN8268_c0_g1~~TRINITY_DN8268_c0_g1_i1.p1  ORF type:complete len:188 (+),score=4.62 TRINITY_DN8268_c0_g1_i1:40-603(+)
MAVMGETCHALTPFGVGATLAQLGRGGFIADNKPKTPQLVHGLGLTNAFSRPPTGGSRQSSPGPRSLSASQSAPSIRSTRESLRSLSSLSKTTLDWSPQNATWQWDNLRSVRSPVRDREVGRVAKLLGASTLHAVPQTTPLGVTQNAYYRRQGLVHGDPGRQTWQTWEGIAVHGRKGYDVSDRKYMG